MTEMSLRALCRCISSSCIHTRKLKVIVQHHVTSVTRTSLLGGLRREAEITKSSLWFFSISEGTKMVWIPLWHLSPPLWRNGPPYIPCHPSRDEKNFPSFAIVHFLNILCVPFWSHLQVIEIHKEKCIEKVWLVIVLGCATGSRFQTQQCDSLFSIHLKRLRSLTWHCKATVSKIQWT